MFSDSTIPTKAVEEYKQALALEESAATASLQGSRCESSPVPITIVGVKSDLVCIDEVP